MDDMGRFQVTKALSEHLGSEVAEAIMVMLPPMHWDELATKNDLAVLGHELRAEMAELRGELRADMAELRGELRADMAKLRGELRSEMAALRQELHSEMATLRRELSGEMATGRVELGGFRAEMAQAMRQQLLWFATIVAGVNSIFVFAGRLVS